MSTEKVQPGEAVEPSGVPPVEVAHDGHVAIDETTGQLVLPSGWMYKRLGRLDWYASPKVQLLLVSFVCFMCPGMFNALGGLGGGGRADPKLADNMNTALYATFAVFGFFGGTFVNKLGVKICLAFGGIGYGIYAISLLVSLHVEDNTGFSIFSGVFLGLCAGLLWTAQGTIMISYPNEEQKGRYFAWFWAIFNMGAVLGSLIPLGTNIHRTEAAQVSDGTYIGFIVLMFFGAVLALCLCNANDVVRPDGTRIVLMKQPSWSSELWGLWETLRFEPFVILLFPMFFVSNWFYTYQFNAVNAAYHNVRTRSLDSLLYWTAQIVAAGVFGYALDIEKIRRSTRAKITWGVLLVLTFSIWGGGYAFEKTYTRESLAAKKDAGWNGQDWSDDGYVGPMFLYIFYGFFDAAWQASVYWFMGALSNSGRRSANFVGFYKGIQSVGAAVVNNLDARELSYEGEFISNWALLGAALVFSAPVVFMKIKDHVALEEDVAGTDETLADILPEGHAEKLAH